MALDLTSARTRVDAVVESLLPPAVGPAARVVEAMRYAVLGGGKRLRPILTLLTCEACGGPANNALEAGAAIEFLHTYSLIHDDLPAMDNDDLRRGRQTVHRAFGDACAILAGDALQALGFEILATRPAASSVQQRLDAVGLVASAVGCQGMIGGQLADLEAEASPVGPDRLDWIHRHKTGALIQAAVVLGAIHAGAAESVREALSLYAGRLGLAFQIHDDVLDVTSTAEMLGKTPGKDERSLKATYPDHYGLQGARSRAISLVDEAVSALQSVPGSALDPEPLTDLAHYVIARDR